MDANSFREFGRAAVDFVADYLETVQDRQVLPDVEPGYLHKLLPTEMPEQPEHWSEVMKDLNQHIMPGITHWQSPNFHAYYPTQTSYPSIVADLICGGLGTCNFSWICSPAATELEVIVMDWLGKFLGLPEEFLNGTEGPGGGCIQGSASEAILVGLLAAREQTVRRIKLEHPEMSESDIRGKLIAYSSDQSNSCVEKNGLLAAVPIRLLPANDEQQLRGNALQVAIDEDLAQGKFPVMCIATFGTTGTCAFDNVEELGPICQANNIWLHIDAAYAGSALVCPEYRYLMKGIDKADSFNFNPHKWLLMNFDLSAMWLKNADLLVQAFNVDRIYLQHQFQGQSKAPDYRHWQLPLGRRNRALKVWTTLRTYGGEKIREKIRADVKMAEMFRDLVVNDARFELATKQSLGLVCFRLKGECSLTQKLLDRITERKKLYMIPAKVHNKLIIRFAICGQRTLPQDIDFAWQEITAQAEIVLAEATRNDTIGKLPTNFAANVVTDVEMVEKQQ